MAKTTAPLLSFGASGQLAKTMVTSSWRGIAYTRRYVVPANPKSEGQQHTRGVFAWLNEVWKLMDQDAQAPWVAFAKGKPLTDRNAFNKFNVQPLRGVGTDYAENSEGFIASPGVAGGLAATAISAASAGAGALAVTLTAPDLPDGWSITNMVCIAMTDKAVWDSTDYTTFTETANAAPYTADFADLATGTYDAFAFFVYQKPNGTTAYSPSLYVQQAVA